MANFNNTALNKTSVSRVLKRYGQQYLDRYGPTMTAQQKKVLRAVMACRETSLGTIRYQCAGCGNTHIVPRSCCNRHCAACQHERTKTWLAQQTERLLPCHYFLVTFTVPQEVRAAMLAHPQAGYAALMSAAVESLKTAATNERHVGASEVGMIGVLHTWSRDLGYHPHVHFLVPGGGIDRFMFQDCGREIGGLTYDRKNNLLYMVEVGAGLLSENEWEVLPVVHVLRLVM